MPTTYATRADLASAVASLLGLSELSASTVRGWTAMGAPTPEAPPFTDAHAHAIADWRREHMRPARRSMGSLGEGDGERWRLEALKLKEEVRRLQNLNERTESRRLDADDVHAQITEACESFKSWLLRDLPGKTFDLCQGQERLISIELVRAQVIEQVNAWVIQNEPSYGGTNAT